MPRTRRIPEPQPPWLATIGEEPQTEERGDADRARQASKRGAPKGNTNAVTHGAYRGDLDPGERLAIARAAKADTKQAARDRDPEALRTIARKLAAVGWHQSAWWARRLADFIADTLAAEAGESPPPRRLQRPPPGTHDPAPLPGIHFPGTPIAPRIHRTDPEEA